MNFHLSRKHLTIEAHVGQGQQQQITEGVSGHSGGDQYGHCEDEAGADDVDQVKHWKENKQSAWKYAINKMKLDWGR